MQDNRLQPVYPQPESQGRVQPRFQTEGHWRFLLVALCYSFLLLVGLSPGVASAGGEKVTLCHVPPGNPAAAHEIVVAPSAVKAHLKNHAGDHLGPCVTPPECQTNSQCNDANPCTVDTCTAAGTCDYSQPVSCNDGNPCTNDVCIAEQGGCVGVPAPGELCDDGDVCTGTDTCNAAGACVGAAIAGCCLNDTACADNDACTADVCNLTSHTCSNTEITPPKAAPCYMFICDPEIGGINVDVPVTCVDDGNICTVEVCDPSIGTRGACVTNPNPNPPEGTQEVSCNDGLDNDCDGNIDSADSDCAPPVTCPCDGDPMWSVAYFQAAIDADEDVRCQIYSPQSISMWEMLYQRSIDVWSGKCWSGPSSILLTPEQIPVCMQKVQEIASQLNPPVTCGGAAF